MCKYDAKNVYNEPVICLLTVPPPQPADGIGLQLPGPKEAVPSARMIPYCFSATTLELCLLDTRYIITLHLSAAITLFTPFLRLKRVYFIFREKMCKR
jgi:hypothetical protein